MNTLYTAQAFSPATTLAEDVSAVATSMAVVDGSVLPDAPNTLSLGEYSGDNHETILYTVKTGNVLSGIVRAVEGSAVAWASGTVVARYFTAKDLNDLQDNFQEMQDSIPELEDGFSPEIAVATNTDTEYVLSITTADGNFNTPNLKGADGEQGTQGATGATGEDGQMVSKANQASTVRMGRMV